MCLKAILLCSALVLGSYTSSFSADGPDYEDFDVIAGIAEDSSVVARIVFVGFPSGQDTLATWSQWLVDEFSNYIGVMSNGNQEMLLEIMKRSGADSVLAWMADSSSSYYSGQGVAGFGNLNTEIMLEIHDEFFAATGDSVWKDVELVLMFHYENAFWRFGVGGAGSINVTGIPGFSGAGTTNRFEAAWGDSFTTATTFRIAKGYGHEYGHTLFGPHTPYT